MPKGVLRHGEAPTSLLGGRPLFGAHLCPIYCEFSLRSRVSLHSEPSTLLWPDAPVVAGVHSKAPVVYLPRTCRVQGTVRDGTGAGARPDSMTSTQMCPHRLPLQVSGTICAQARNHTAAASWDRAFTLDLVAPGPCLLDPVPKWRLPGKWTGLPGAQWTHGVPLSCLWRRARGTTSSGPHPWPPGGLDIRSHLASAVPRPSPHSRHARVFSAVATAIRLQQACEGHPQ